MKILTRKKQNISALPSNNFSLLSILLLLTAAILSSGSAAIADIWHVKPSSEVPIRSGQGTDYKILAVVADGLKIEILEEEEPWAKVRTPGGTEGWMLKRYLSSDPPLSQTVASLRARNTALETEKKEMSGQLVEVSAAHTRNEEELQACIVERDSVQQEYQTLREDTADVIKIKKNLSEKIQETQKANQKLAAIEQENKDLKRNTALMWFLAGGFLLIIGWIIGMMTGKSRKRKSSLL